MLQDLGIIANRITILGKSKNGLVTGFAISKFGNLCKFVTTIGFSNHNKKQKLVDSLGSFKQLDVQLELTKMKMKNPTIFK
jgi:hypothetical protein